MPPVGFFMGVGYGCIGIGVGVGGVGLLLLIHACIAVCDGNWLGLSASGLWVM